MPIVYDGVLGAFKSVSTLVGINDLVYVRAASTVNLGATYAGGVLTATADGALVLDQVAVVGTNRVLMKNQDTREHNGIYDVTEPGSGEDPGPGSPFVLTRSSDCDSSEDLATKPVIVVTEGVANSSAGLQLSNTGEIELGVTGLRFTQFTGGVEGISAEALDAIGLANAPSAANVFATMADVGGGGGGGDTLVRNWRGEDSFDIGPVGAGNTGTATVSGWLSAAHLSFLKVTGSAGATTAHIRVYKAAARAPEDLIEEYLDADLTLPMVDRIGFFLESDDDPPTLSMSITNLAGVAVTFTVEAFAVGV